MRNTIDFENITINGRHSYFLEYYKKCMSGEYIVGQEIKKVLQNCMDDLMSDKYDYHSKEVHTRMAFAETFCKQTKNTFYGKPIKYLLWQKARKEVTFSFYYADTDRRKYTEVLELVARKNGKSTDKASEGNTDLFLGAGGLDIVCSSNDDAQADLIFQEIANMRESIDPKNKYSKKVRAEIKHLTKKSKIFKISDKTRNKEGRNIYSAYIDEIHEMKDNTIFMSIYQSTSIAKNPIIYEITTEGMVEDGYLDKRLAYARKVLNKEIEDEGLLVWLYTQDSEEEVFADESSWWKSNPSMGVIKGWDYLRRQVEKARVSREDRAFILCKDFNIKQNRAVSWLLEDEVRNEGTFPLEHFRGAYYIAGVDLSETTDLTALNILIEAEGQIYCHTMYFVPESKADGDLILNGERKDYREWARLGYCIIVAGNEVNNIAPVEYLWFLFETYDLRPYKIGYDNWSSRGMVEDIERRFGSDIPVKVRQDFNNMSNPMRSLGADLKDKKVNYQNNPITRWCLKNVATKTNNIGQIMAVKTQGVSSNRIDGAISMIICYNVRAMYYSDFTLLSKSNKIYMEGSD